MMQMLRASLAVLFTTVFTACAHKPTVAVPEPAPAPAPVAAAPAPAPAPAPVAPSPEEVLARLLAETVIHFEFDSDQLTGESQSRLQKVAQALRAHEQVRVTIEGHCDERGTAEYNLALGNRRAEVAKRYLAALGVEPHRLETISFGHERPAVHGQGEDAWAANRRDEFTVRR